MSYEPESFRDLLEKEVTIGPVMRVLLAAIVILGGLVFILLGCLFLFLQPTVPPPHPVGAGLLSLIVAMMGLGFVWISSRLFRERVVSCKLLFLHIFSHSRIVVAAFSSAR